MKRPQRSDSFRRKTTAQIVQENVANRKAPSAYLPNSRPASVCAELEIGTVSESAMRGNQYINRVLIDRDMPINVRLKFCV